MTMLPECIKGALQRHLRSVRRLHRDDLTLGYESVYLPFALEKKYPNASREWCWQYAFPSGNRSVDPRSGQERRHHPDKSRLPRALRKAVKYADLAKQINCHTFRHSFATSCRQAMTSARCRNCWATRMCKRP